MKNTLFWGIAVSAVFSLTGCQPPATNTTTTNTNSTNVSANSSNINTSNSNLTSNTASTSTIETKEPEQYQAKVSIKLETSGDTQKATVPTIAAFVARDGDKRRMEFTLPNNEKLIYLDLNGKNLLISPSRKQYAEINKDAVGFEVRRLLMPEQIVNQVKTVKGVELVGEEQFNGRPITKYRYGAVANTQTQAGQVTTESFLLVDKESGLPIRSETVAQSQNGQVQGMKQLKVVTEMSDIQTNNNAELFVEPTDYKKVAPEEIRAQVNMLVQLGVAIAGQMMQQAAPAASATPAASTTPAASPTGN